MNEFIQSIMNDVNQQSDDADRFLDRTSLGNWAGTEKSNGFDSFLIYWDEDRKDKYETAPDPQNIFQPFLNSYSTLIILQQLFLTGFVKDEQKPKLEEHVKKEEGVVVSETSEVFDSPVLEEKLEMPTTEDSID